MDHSSEVHGAQKQVFAIVALLDDDHTAKVHEIWRVLEKECGLKALRVPPYPHFSFHGAQRYQMPEFNDHITSLAKILEPFRIRTTGLSVFTGSKPVVFIPLVSSETLLSVHRVIWEETSRFGENLNPYYQPGHWVPHLTLIHDGVDAACLSCVFAQFLDHSFVWEVEIKKLALIYQKGDQYGIQQEYPLTGM